MDEVEGEGESRGRKMYEGASEYRENHIKGIVTSSRSYMYTSRRQVPIVCIQHRNADIDDPSLYKPEELEKCHEHTGQAIAGRHYTHDQQRLNTVAWCTVNQGGRISSFRRSAADGCSD